MKKGDELKFSGGNITIRVCPVCGKEFVPAAMHVYKVRLRNFFTSVCSWSCVRSWEKQKEEEKARKEINDERKSTLD